MNRRLWPVALLVATAAVLLAGAASGATSTASADKRRRRRGHAVRGVAGLPTAGSRHNALVTDSASDSSRNVTRILREAHARAQREEPGNPYHRVRRVAEAAADYHAETTAWFRSQGDSEAAARAEGRASRARQRAADDAGHKWTPPS